MTGVKDDSGKKRGILSFFKNVSTNTNVPSSAGNGKGEELNDDVEVQNVEESESDNIGDDSIIILNDAITEEEKDNDIDEKVENILDDIEEPIEVEEAPIEDDNVESDEEAENVAIEEPKTSETRQKEHDDGNNDEENEIESQEKDEKTKKKEARKLKLQEEKQRKEKLRQEEKLKKEKQRQEEKLKKEKLRQEEKLKRERQRQEEKLQREKQRQEEKRKREELKNLKKEQERQKKELERQKKEQEKLKREEEKRKIEEEKKAKEEAKERAQSRIGNFFKKSSNDTSRKIQTKSDYEKTFLPFYSKDNIIVSNYFKLNENKLNSNKKSIDTQLSNHNSDDTELFEWIKSKKATHGYNIKFKAVTLLQQMTTKEKTDEELQILLSLIPQKYIKFYENVRPPFIGTYSKDFSLPIDTPFSTDGTGYNYDYDSDLEWVNEEDEEGDGGDIDNLESGEDDEDDEDEEDGSEGEFDGFLDAEDPNNIGSSKKKLIGPLIPVVYLRTDIDKVDKDDKKYFEDVSAKSIMENQLLPIDPRKKIIIQRQTDQPTNSSPKKDNQLQGNKRSATDDQNVLPEKDKENKKAKTVITEPKDLLKLFDEVYESTFSLGTITEIAQKGLPQYSKQTIKNTIREYAARASSKIDVSRKWEIKDHEFWNELKTKIE